MSTSSRKESLRIVMLGPPGAGKGTQAVMCAQQYNIPHISTGEMMRAAIKSETALGKKVKKFLDDGALVPDALILEVIKERLAQSDCNSGFILDGFPRTVTQSRELDTLLKGMLKPLTHIIELKVSEETLLQRIQLRGASGSGRSDDQLEVATNRLKVYWELTAPVTKYYQESKAPLYILDGLGSVEEVKARIDQVVG